MDSEDQTDLGKSKLNFLKKCNIETTRISDYEKINGWPINISSHSKPFLYLNN